MQRELHPTLLSSLEGIVDQMVWFRENWHEEVRKTKGLFCVCVCVGLGLGLSLFIQKQNIFQAELALGVSDGSFRLRDNYTRAGDLLNLYC